MLRLGHILVIIICITFGFKLHANPHTDTVFVYFQRGYSIVDPLYAENQKNLKKLFTDIKKFTSEPSKYNFKLHLQGNSSPDGLTAANKRLTEKRVQSILNYLNHEITIPDSLITISAEGIDWKGLAHLVETDSTCPARDQVLNIVNNTPEWIFDSQNRIIDGRKKQLMDLQRGIPYNYLMQNTFPLLRNTCITLYYEHERVQNTPSPELPATMTEEMADNSRIEIVSVPPTIPPAPQTGNNTLSESIVPNPGSEPVAATPNGWQTAVTEREVRKTDSLEYLPNQRIAIKTNLLYDAVLMPALEIEYRINDRWSAAVEGSVAWWKNDGAHKYYQIATIIPEGRYWFHTKAPWHGHYVGLFVGGSWYDLENGKRGYKGEFVTTGISYGYMFPIGRALSLEAGIGVGFLHTTYEEYLPIDGHYVYQQTSRTNWFGPVKLKFALVWRLGKKQGGTVR